MLNMNQQLRLLRFVPVLFILVFCSHFSYAQERGKIKGIVTDSLQKPMAGATVIQVGGSARTVADEKGAFELNAPLNSDLQIQMTGYQSKTIKAINGMVITLLPKVSSLDEVVVVGYGTQQKRNLTT